MGPNDGPDGGHDDAEQLTTGVYRYEDTEHGNVVYFGVFDGEVNSVSAVPMDDEPDTRDFPKPPER